MNDEYPGLVKEFVRESIDFLDEAAPKLIGRQMAGDIESGVDPELICWWMNWKVLFQRSAGWETETQNECSN